MNDFFNTLGIEATKEEKKIKKAYRARLHAVNPEDDPDGFKRLREAYEEALKYARQKEEEPENLDPDHGKSEDDIRDEITGQMKLF